MTVTVKGLTPCSSLPGILILFFFPEVDYRFEKKLIIVRFLSIVQVARRFPGTRLLYTAGTVRTASPTNAVLQRPPMGGQCVSACVCSSPPPVAVPCCLNQATATAAAVSTALLSLVC